MLASIRLERDEVGACRVAVGVQEIMRGTRREDAFMKHFNQLTQGIEQDKSAFRS